MICQKTNLTKTPNQTDTQTTKRINVTNMTPSERRKLFVNCISQNGFKAFIKNKENKQTFYEFQYENA